jgi:hypothetical protein
MLMLLHVMLQPGVALWCVDARSAGVVVVVYMCLQRHGRGLVLGACHVEKLALESLLAAAGAATGARPAAAAAAAAAANIKPEVRCEALTFCVCAASSI